MPSKSPAQARLMAAAAHNSKFAKKVGVPQGVASEFNAADQLEPTASPPRRDVPDAPGSAPRPPPNLKRQAALATALRRGR